MQVKAIKVLPSHPIDGVSYITPGAIYEVLEVSINGICDIIDDVGELIAIDIKGKCAHAVVWEVVDAS